MDDKAARRALDAVRKVPRDRTTVLAAVGTALLLGAFFRSLVGTTTFQTEAEVALLLASCGALAAGLQALCVRAGAPVPLPLVAVAMSAGALLDIAFGLAFGRTSTIPVTIALLIGGAAALAAGLGRRDGAQAAAPWRASRVPCSYETLAYPLIYLALLIITLGSVFGCLFILHVGGLDRGVSQLGFFVGCALAGAIVAALLPRGAACGLERLAKAALLLMIAGISLFLLLQPSFLSLLVLAAGFCCFIALAAGMTFDLYRCFALPALMPAGYLLFLTLSIPAGLFMGRLLLLSGSVENLENFTVAAMLVVNVTSLMGLGVRHPWSAAALVAGPDACGERGEAADPWGAAVDAIAAEAGLTRREVEVLALMARGRNAARVEQALVISNHTARAHILRIYKKLGRHSQQEVIDLVEERVAGR